MLGTDPDATSNPLPLRLRLYPGRSAAVPAPSPAAAAAANHDTLIPSLLLLPTANGLSSPSANWKKPVDKQV